MKVHLVLQVYGLGQLSQELVQKRVSRTSQQVWC